MKVSKTEAKKKAWKAFSAYLRTFWTKTGTAQCYTCHKYFGFSNIQVGHFITGHGNAIYINEEYVRPQCRQCNIYKGRALGDFRDNLRKELGDKAVDDLVRLARETVIISVAEYQELERWYKEQLKLLVDK